MKKPLIGLTPSHNTDSGDIQMRPTYLKALMAAGAIPVILPLTSCVSDLKQFADILDGFLFTGGPDVHPFLFGEETQAHCGSVSPERDQMELALLPIVMETAKPILGICRGVQLLNIGLGGNIWQDIPSQTESGFPLAHSQPFAFSIPAHTVTVKPGSRLAEITQSETLSVNSMHHQAVKDVAPGLTATAFSSDHIVEAVEMTDYPFFIGVQWHPEYLWEKDDASLKLFQAFVNASRSAGGSL